jgi:hypothetical protein
MTGTMTGNCRTARMWLIAAVVAMAAAAAGEDEIPAGNDDSATLRAALFGRGVHVDGDARKYREDYDDLQSGGGIDFNAHDESENGTYATAAGSILFAERGNAFDGAEVAFAGGRWGRYHFRGNLSLLQSYYDDSYERPLIGFPFSNELGRDLHTNRANVDVEATALLGERGSLSVRYLHDEMEGDRSILKGSVVENLSVFGFQAPGFQDVDRRADAVDVRAVLPAGPVQLAIDAGYRNEDKTIGTNEINYAAAALRDRVVYTDSFDVDVVQGGVLLSVADDPRLQGHAGYRIAWVDSKGSSAQRGGTTSLDARRVADDADVDSLTHLGHAGLVLRPLDDLALRASYAVRDRDRSGWGSEVRTAIDGGSAQTLNNDTQKDLFSHRPRVSVTYSGLPRTRLRADYAFDKTSRDLDLRSLVDGDGAAAIDRIQRTDEDIYTHKARVGARTRLTRWASTEVGYDLLREEIDQTVHELLNESTLGDRERDRDRVFAKLRLRASGRTSFETGGEWDRGEFRRTDVGGDSSTRAEGYRVHAQVNSSPLTRLSTHAAVSWVDRDYTVGEDNPRALAIFRDIEFRNRFLAGSLLAAWAATSDLALRGRYSIAAASGSLDNLSQRLHVDASYQATEILNLAAGYSFLGFDEDLWPDDDFDGHFAWARFELAF